MTDLPARTDLPVSSGPAPGPYRSALPVPPLWLGALAGLITGLVTIALTQNHSFTVAHPAVTAALIALVWVLGLGTVFLGAGSLEVGSSRPLLSWVAGLAAFTSVAAALHGGGDLPVVLAVTLALAGAALIAARHAGRAGLLPFLVSSVLVAGLAGILASLFIGLLELAAALVDAVGFPGLQKRLDGAWVPPPLALAAAGFFVAALRQARWAGTLTQTLATLLGFLLPVAALIIVLFTLLLPVAALTDPKTLYDGLLSSYLYLSLTLVKLALTASVTAGRPLPAWAAQPTRIAALLLPLYPLLAVYGLSTRALQYGLTPDRVLGLAASVWLLVTAALNAWNGWRRDRPVDPEEAPTRPAYVSMLLLAGLSVLLSVPGLRPPDLSARSQATRLHDPALSAAEATSAVLYLRDRGGPAGKTTLSTLGKQTLPSAAQVRVRDALKLSTASFSSKYPRGTGTLSQTLQEAALQPITGSGPVDTARLEAIRQNLLESESSSGNNATYSSYCSNPGDTCILRLYALPAGKVFGDIETLILLLGPYQPSEGVWFGFRGEQIARQGRYGPTYAEPQGSFSKTPFEGGAVTTSITLPALKVQGNVLFLTEDRTSLTSK